MDRMVKNEFESQEQVELDQFAYRSSLQRPMNNRRTHPRRGVVLTGRVVLGEHRQV